jgi:hypothetical protein
MTESRGHHERRDHQEGRGNQESRGHPNNYKRVEKAKERAPDNEVRINKQTPLSNYVKYILSQFSEKNA